VAMVWVGFDWNWGGGFELWGFLCGIVVGHWILKRGMCMGSVKLWVKEVFRLWE